MENNKYRIVDGRIVALIDIPEAGVKVGDLGGRVTSEHNLSFWPGTTCWIDRDSTVRNEARVEDDAQVKNSNLRDRANATGGAVIVGSSLNDDSWVSGNAKLTNSDLYERARVTDDAIVSFTGMSGYSSVGANGRVEHTRLTGVERVSRNGHVTDNQHAMTIGPIGSEDRTIEFYRSNDGTGLVRVGCFAPASLDALATHVEALHGDEHEERWRRYGIRHVAEMDRWRDEYMAAIALMRIREASWSK